MTTAFTAFVTQISRTLDDAANATWSTAEIATFLNDAIRDYSVHFPRIQTDSITVTAGTQEYDLNADFMGVLSVEYPDGQDPREYLTRKAYSGEGFWESDEYYDIIPRADDDSDVNQILFSGDLTTDAVAVVEYHAHHRIIADVTSISNDNTVPVMHQPLLIKYCQWQAALFLASAEQQSPTSSSSLLMAQLAQNARRLELSYNIALQQAIYADEGKSRPLKWISTESKMERIY